MLLTPPVAVDSGWIYGDQSCLSLPLFFLRAVRNAPPNLAVNYDGAFSAAATFPSPLKYSTIGPLMPPVHFYAADYPFPLPSRPAEFSVIRSSLPASLSVAQIEKVDRTAGYIYCVIICSCTSPFIYGTISIAFPTLLL